MVFRFLQPELFTIPKGRSYGTAFPAAHTCVNTLDLPEYTSKEALEQHLHFAFGGDWRLLWLALRPQEPPEMAAVEVFSVVSQVGWSAGAVADCTAGAFGRREATLAFSL